MRFSSSALKCYVLAFPGRGLHLQIGKSVLLIGFLHMVELGASHVEVFSQ